MTALSQQITANGWMVPVLRPAVKHFWESCQGLGGSRRRLPPCRRYMRGMRLDVARCGGPRQCGVTPAMEGGADGRRARQHHRT
jgi:hypothetical protein